MRTDSYQIHREASYARALYIGGLIGRALGHISQFISKAWRSSSSRGTNSNALS